MKTTKDKYSGLEDSIKKALNSFSFSVLAIFGTAILISIVTRLLPSPISMVWGLSIDSVFIIGSGILLYYKVKRMYIATVQNDKLMNILEDHSKIVDNAGVGIWHLYIKDGLPKRMDANPKMLEIMGVEDQNLSDEQIFNFWFDRVVPSALPSVLKSVDEMKKGHISENTYQWRHPKKGIVYIRCGGTSERLDDGTYLLSGYNYDVTTIVEADISRQKVLSEALQAAEQSNRAKSVFLNNMSHDIRTPMNAIVGFTVLAYSHIDNRDLVSDYLSKISTASQHLLRLINDVLDMSRIESGKVTIDEKGICLTDVVNELQTITQADISAKELRFSVDISDIRHKYIMADKLRLNQVLLNIISNSIKYTHDRDSISLTILERGPAKGDNATYEFRIKDTGIGMSEEFQKHIFEPFTREKTSTVSGIQGTGLGMAITKNIVTMMGGTINVSSVLDKGTEFVVTLQFKVVSDDAVATKVVKEPSLIDLRPCKISQLRNILLVEDNELNLEIAQTILEEDGYNVDVASDGDVAVDIMKSAAPGRYDLILMDIQMPTMNGYDATRAIRALPDERNARIPIIAMTANAFAEDIAMANEAGMDAHLAKPIDVNVLRNTISEILSDRR